MSKTMTDAEKKIVVEYMELASKIASKASNHWQLVSKEDIEAHLWEWLCKNVQHLIKWKNQTMLKNAELLLMNEEPIGDGRPYVSLNREANKFCAEQTKPASKHGDLNNDNHYTPAMVYRVMERLFTYDFTNHHMQGTDNTLSFNVMYDVMNAFHGLNYKDKELLEMKYKHNKSMDYMVEELGVSSTAVEKRIERAVHRLYDKLAGEPINWVRGKPINVSTEWI
jgi:hypothetical protein